VACDYRRDGRRSAIERYVNEVEAERQTKRAEWSRERLLLLISFQP
jgi:hypothetical protein